MRFLSFGCWGKQQQPSKKTNSFVCKECSFGESLVFGTLWREGFGRNSFKEGIFHRRFSDGKPIVLFMFIQVLWFFFLEKSNEGNCRRSDYMSSSSISPCFCDPRRKILPWISTVQSRLNTLFRILIQMQTKCVHTISRKNTVLECERWLICF